MPRLRSSLFLVLPVLLVLASYNHAETTATPPGAVVSYQVQGILKSIDAHSRQALISHREIPGYMAAMTMSFDFVDPRDFEALQPGDALSFRLCVSGNRAWIDQVQKQDSKTDAPFTFTAPEHQPELGVGDLAPDIAFVNQSGKQIALHDFRGKALAITFVYTRCPLPTYCPLLNQNFATAQALLGKLTPRRDWHLLSVTLDAEHDTPEVLTEYSRTFKADISQWTFATAQETALRQFSAAIGLEFKKSATGIDHNLRTVVLDESGRIRRIFQGNRWTPQELAAELRKAMPQRQE